MSNNTKLFRLKKNRRIVGLKEFRKAVRSAYRRFLDKRGISDPTMAFCDFDYAFVSAKKSKNKGK